jgi:hypothetical protein
LGEFRAALVCRGLIAECGGGHVAVWDRGDADPSGGRDFTVIICG